MPGDDATPFERSRALKIGLLLLIAAIAVLSGVRLARSWPTESHLGYAEGIWIGLAIDAAHGVFYRPLEGLLGYGGTRYFPLFFGAHAEAIRLGLAPILAGHLLAIASVVLLLGGVGLWVRRLGAAWLPSLAAAAVALACQPVQLALLTIRGDALPAALSVLGLAVCAGPGLVVWRLAPVLFALAFAAKPTSLYAPAAVVIALLLAGRRRDAAVLTMATGAGLALVLAAMYIVSDGRAFAVIAASATGGAGWAALLSAPIGLAHILRRTPEVVFLLLVVVAWVFAGWRRALTLEIMAGATCLLVTTAIYASPATVENHLIDVTAIAIVILGGVAARYPRLTRGMMALLLVSGAAGLAGGAWRLTTEDGKEMRAPRLATLATLTDTRRPIFFQQPMLAAHLAESSYLLDPFLFSVRVTDDAAAMNRLLDDLDHQTFGAIVLEHTSPTAALEDLSPRDIGRFLTALDRNYAVDAPVEGRLIYRPRAR